MVLTMKNFLLFACGLGKLPSPKISNTARRVRYRGMFVLKPDFVPNGSRHRNTRKIVWAFC